MKLLLLLIIAASIVIEGFVNADGYLKDYYGCKMKCPIPRECNRYCKDQGGNYGYCYLNGLFIGCWCEGLPQEKAWKKGSDC
uniref:Putative depressant toxin Tx354 n=1 Tax=Buthus israelis TaxID=2899555 RepID=B8XH10_BUTIS|nr:putative depressant toxin Tx354 [Buthus occitanus israelis]